MEITNALIEQYIELFSEKEPELLQRLNRETHVKILQPRMLSGAIQGRFLSLISHLCSPKLILEIGTYTGYSALCLAEGLRPDGKLITIDINEELEDFTKKYFDESIYKDQIDYRIGDAKEEIKGINQEIDLCFIDADKKSYPYYLDQVVPKMKKGGVILVDNVLWDGKVAEEDKQDKTTNLLRDFNKKIAENPLLQPVLLPLRDGIYLIRVK
ncbi:MAG: hypothetical protein RIR51_1119 [Bacteroidota bacterium]|jgi:predicted O-methyltransferase YrrM